MILIALGANLPSSFGDPERTLEEAMRVMTLKGLRVVKASRIWVTAPVPVSDQPFYRNAVVAVESGLAAREIFKVLKEIEKEFGRVPAERNAARVLDLDLLACGEEVSESPRLILPHPRMHKRGFVLQPLQEIAPEWMHPKLKKTVTELVAELPEDMDGRPMDRAA